MNDLHTKHMELVDEVNNATTEHAHWTASVRLHGWREGVVDAGRTVDLIAADLEQFSRGFENRPMCCGVFLEWAPAKEL